MSLLNTPDFGRRCRCWPQRSNRTGGAGHTVLRREAARRARPYPLPGHKTILVTLRGVPAPRQPGNPAGACPASERVEQPLARALAAFGHYLHPAIFQICRRAGQAQVSGPVYDPVTEADALHPALDPGGEACGSLGLTSVIASRHVPLAFPAGRSPTLACYSRSGSGILAITRIERHQIHNSERMVASAHFQRLRTVAMATLAPLWNVARNPVSAAYHTAALQRVA